MKTISLIYSKRNRAHWFHKTIVCFKRRNDWIIFVCQFSVLRSLVIFQRKTYTIDISLEKKNKKLWGNLRKYFNCNSVKLLFRKATNNACYDFQSLIESVHEKQKMFFSNYSAVIAYYYVILRESYASKGREFYSLYVHRRAYVRMKGYEVEWTELYFQVSYNLIPTNMSR